MHPTDQSFPSWDIFQSTISLHTISWLRQPKYTALAGLFPDRLLVAAPIAVCYLPSHVQVSVALPVAAFPGVGFAPDIVAVAEAIVVCVAEIAVVVAPSADEQSILFLPSRLLLLLSVAASWPPGAGEIPASTCFGVVYAHVWTLKSVAGIHRRPP